ncbi:MAG TPA: hypothetical protein VIK11_11220 [Tepidiformaceae bacterium]
MPVPFLSSSQSRHPQGLMGSLVELSMASSLLAVCMPVLVLVVHLVTGHPLDSAPSSTTLPGPLVAITFASFVLVPMLALVGAAASLAVAGGTVMSRERRKRELARAFFVVCVAVWGVITAYVYDVFVIPVITK